MAGSFGYNRNEMLDDYYTSKETYVSPTPIGLVISPVNGQRFYTNNHSCPNVEARTSYK